MRVLRRNGTSNEILDPITAVCDENSRTVLVRSVKIDYVAHRVLFPGADNRGKNAQINFRRVTEMV